MAHANPSLKDRVLDRDDDLRDAIELLLERANLRQMWLMFIDERGCLGDPLMPVDDYPEDPDEPILTPDLGEVRHARLFMHRMGSFLELTGNRAIVLTWERRGSSTVRADDRAWAQAAAEEALALGVPLRAQFLLHSRGVRQLHPDDYF